MSCYCFYAGYCCYCRARYAKKKGSGISSIYLATGMIALIMAPTYLLDAIPMFHRSIARNVAAGFAFAVPWAIYFGWETLKGSSCLESLLTRIAVLMGLAFPVTMFGATYYLVLSR